MQFIKFVSMEKINVVICWFRRDLRIIDNPALFYALNSGLPVLPLFIFDTGILSKLPPLSPDKRVSFIHRALSLLEKEFKSRESFLLSIKGNPADVFSQLTSSPINEFIDIKEVHYNKDYEPEAIKRDHNISEILLSKGIKLISHKEQVIFEENEIVKKDGTPYTVYTPYSKKWIENLLSTTESVLNESPAEKHLHNLAKESLLSGIIKESFTGFNIVLPSIATIGFTKSAHNIALPFHISEIIIDNYHNTRDIPSLQQTSMLSPHLRFGTIGIKRAVRSALNNTVFLKELVWREFFKMILFHFPYVQDNSFKEKYRFIEWRNDYEEFIRWCEGNTGYPIVDAGMRELNATGLMHNRVRMITASFLTKNLLIDWKIGEAYFAEKLLDYDLSSNNGNWQWVAGTGCDAAPYFRIFNPYEQTRKYDPDSLYIKKWVPEYKEKSYPEPICNHKEARERTLQAYGRVLL